MKKIEVYVHTANGVEPRLVQTSEDATVKQLIQAIVAIGGVHPGPDGEVRLFVEDSDEPLEAHRKVCECEVRHRHHVHCHSCKRVKVSVFYNGEEHESFPPSATVKRVLKWAIKAFSLTPAEAADKILVLHGSTTDELPLDAHIGSFVKGHECVVNLDLTAPVEVQG